MNDYDQEIIAHLKLESPSIGHHRLICPCAASRKPANRRERTLSVDVDFERVVFYCQHCEGRGAYSLKDTGFVPKTYSPPAPMKKLDITKARDNSAQEWLENERLIPNEIHQRYGVKFVELYGDPAVAFVYGNPRKGAKLRKIEEKRFAVDGKIEDPYLWEYVDFEKEYLHITEGECFPGDAEVLTPDGWVRFDSYIGQPVCSVEQSGQASFEKPIAIIRKEYSGSLVRLETKGYVSITTPGHNLITVTTNSRVDKGGWRKVRADENDRFTTEPMPRTCKIDGPGILLSNDQISFALAVSADAAIDQRKDGRRYARVSFVKERKIERFRALLQSLGIKFIETIQPSALRHTFFGFHIPEWAPGRLLPHEWLGLATADQREFILKEMVNWDGNSVPNRNQTEYSSKYYENATFMQTLAHTSGRCSSIIRRSNAYGNWLKASILHGKSTTSRQCLSRTDIPHEGLVYCVQTKRGTLLVRQEDKITVTGNCDALSLAAAGFDNIISVPHGASNSQRDDNQKLSFLSSHADKFARFKKITLACDNDEPGIALQNELARRLGRPRCFGWSPPEDCKDANTVLSKRGAEALKRSIEEAKPYRTPGVERASIFKADLLRFRRGEIGAGISTGLEDLDTIFKVSKGLLTVVTGLPGSGKSELVDSIHVHLAREHNWKIGIWSAENPPHAHISKLIEKYHHKKFHLGAPNLMSDEDIEAGADWVDKHFFFLTQEGDNTPDSIVERFQALVMSEGIDGVVVDPYNFISLPGIGREDKEISDMLSKFLTLCKQSEIHMFLIAHPRNVEGNMIPNGRTISGGAVWAAKADFGLTVHRKEDESFVLAKNWKTRWSNLGKEGTVELGYDTKTADYYDLGSNPAPSKNRYLDDDEILW